MSSQDNNEAFADPEGLNWQVTNLYDHPVPLKAVFDVYFHGCHRQLFLLFVYLHSANAYSALSWVITGF